MFIITPSIAIPQAELNWRFVRSSGPGGQNVNKVASKAVLSWDVASTRSLPEDVKGRLQKQNRRRLTKNGILLLTSQRFRDQEKNRTDCLEKLRALVLQAAVRPKVRRPTRPTRGSRESRLQGKKHRAAARSRRRLPEE